MPKVTLTALNIETGPHLQMFADAGFEVAPRPTTLNVFKEDDLIAALADSDAVVAGSEPYTRRVLEALPKLRVIARRGVGYDAIDLQAADDCNIVVTTTPGVLHHAVAEHAIAMLMGIARGFPRLDQDVRSGHWRRIATPRVMGKTLGILGLGQIGQAVATRAVGLGMKIMAYDPFPNEEFAKQWNVTYAPLEEVLASCEFVSLHLPMAPEHYKMMNRAAFAKMKPGTFFINTARGQVVNEEDLVEALQSGHLGGAALDVFQEEPLPLDSPLLKCQNTLLSGHMAGLDIECEHDIAVVFAETVISLYRGEWTKPERVRNLKGCTDWKW